ncbi:PREDICTED: uncharacterized protein LOC105963266 [Erythranthe guttata]|nr:PREDICTED: uncharacterized protein LOC105963266 [Erythranthe guttata]|eukprot:XP_012843114.1 PREDICTED: uncharacterized protein LOC105963266 [Erythranthe guttata]
MNEIREVAEAYYARATVDEKNSALDFFRSLDDNNDGTISHAEFRKLVDPSLSTDKLFKELDKNNDGTLDFNEVLALYYIQKCGARLCDVCRDILLTSYFSCLLCEKHLPYSFDLCCGCYGGGAFEHRHPPSKFIDNRSIRLLLDKIMKHAEVSESGDDVKLVTAKELFDAFGNGVKIGNAAVHIGNFAVVAGCCIM